MPTLITHALVGGAAAQAARPGWRQWRFASAAVLCSVLPDFDVVGFSFGVHYGDLWGHRGMMHSLVFAASVGGAIGLLFKEYPHPCFARVGHPESPSTDSSSTPDSSSTIQWRERAKSALLLFLVMASHDVLDAFTSGGLGIAFFAPFSNHRYFFPWTPIRVSPIGLHRFFSARGFVVMWSEVRWVWMPLLLLTVLAWRLRKPRMKPPSLIC